MPRISLAGWKDPIRRPRYIIWTGAVVFVLALVVIVALGATSTFWFCAEVCHKVQDDTIIAYENSTHNKISCMACHMPVGSDPVTFLIHKATALGELYMTVTNQFELPLNPGSHVALNAEEFPDEKCTQCHSDNREFTPSEGIIINHQIHTQNDVRCTICHNRVAHRENFELTLEGNTKHDDFMKMDACFRCHGLESDAMAPGECGACHPADFELRPENHVQAGFYPKGHAEMARDSLAEVAEAEAGGAHGEEGEGGGEAARTFIDVAYAQEAEGEEKEIKAVAEVFYCATCHEQKFCDGCHGMEIPHPEEFRQKAHPETSKKSFAKCVMCHSEQARSVEGTSAAVVIKAISALKDEPKMTFCDECHHGTKVAWKFDAKVAWTRQHADTVRDKGVAGCLGECHEQKFCEDCHTARKPLPTSHKAGDWLRKAAEAKGTHAESSVKEITACEVCHGKGGTKARFCKACHKLEMPHPEQFTDFHAKTGRSRPKVCANCHTFRELCSNCHHEGASNKRGWNAVHGGIVNKSGSAGCFEKCHKKDFCNACHNKVKALPASHKAKDWTRRPTLTKAAKHPQVFEANAENCTYCHGEGGVKSKFCTGCHKLEMPHPGDFKDTHKASFQSKKLSRKTCTNCHTQQFCDKCHHDYTGKERWRTRHDQVVKAKGAEACFECHKETYCSHCHVRLIH